MLKLSYNLGSIPGSIPWSIPDSVPWVQFLGQEDPLEKEMVSHPNILA